MPEENKQEPKKIKWWWWLICGFVVFLMILWISNTDTSPNSYKPTQTTTQKQEKVDEKLQAVNDRIEHLKDLYSWEETPEHWKSESIITNVECENGNCKDHIMFTFDKYSIELDTFARWQAVNFSKDTNWPIFVTAIYDGEFERCFANRWQIQTDYENNGCKKGILN